MANRLDKWVLTLVPVYGRDYASDKEAMEAWLWGKDFRVMAGGPFLSRRDTRLIKVDGFTHVNIRYSKQERNVEIEL